MSSQYPVYTIRLASHQRLMDSSKGRITRLRWPEKPESPGAAFPAASRFCCYGGGGRRKQRIREGGADNPGKENCQKMADIQLEHLVSPGMRPGIGQDVLPSWIGPGAVRYRPLLQHMVQDS